MQATKRKHEPGVIAQLLAEPHRFQFAQLLNILLGLLRRHGVPYEKAFGEVLRFRNNLSLAFPASEIQAIEVEPKAPVAVQDVAHALHSAAVRKVRITPAFIGLLGAGGTLPLHDTERIAARQSLDGDPSQRELLDVFSNRMTGLFYEAWGKYRVEHGIDIREHDRLLPMLTAMAGSRRGEAGRTGTRVRVQDEVVAFYAGLLRTRPVSAATVERVLADYFDVPIRLEPFGGCWDAIPEKRRSTLGTTAPTLGCGAALGVRMWRHDLRALLHIGPLDEAQITAFLPGGSALSALQEMVRLFAVPSLQYEIRLLPAPSYIKRMALTTKAEPKRLGWNTFLTSTLGVVRHPEIKSMLRCSKLQSPKQNLE
jgi:type VI secretion system protein ImpH